MQKLALQASGANAVALGGMGFPGLPMMAGMMPGMGGMSPLETPTKVVALTQVSYLLMSCCE